MVVDAIRNEAIALKNGSGNRNQIMVLFAKLMQQQRDLTTQGKLSKLKVVEFKALIEKLHLTLSNLKYESQHLVKQIDDCDLQE
ncbi:hypothetical protein HDV03_002695 [Kappamyces sp. JEL0829]|nr:hypothetical protein HDV03_002695 [Kappamyces sp. JEL0829]